jgi:colanic acid/amylovoran biosynthesis glycosyltransferase
MKIAFVISSFPTLSQTFILSQITALLDRGVQIDIFARGSGNDPVVHSDVERYNLRDRTYYFGKQYQNVPRSFPRRAAKALVLFGKSASQKPLPLLRSFNFFKFGRQAGKMSLFYKMHKLISLQLSTYDIIHCHFGDTGREIVHLKRLGLTSGKIITTFYGWDCSSYIKEYGNEVYNELNRYGDLFLCLSTEMKERLRELGFSEKKIVIHHLGIDTDRFQTESGEYRRNGTIRLLTVGRMVEKKGISYAIGAVSKLIAKYPQIEYTIVGDGPLRQDLEKLVANLGIAQHVHFTGSKNQTGIIAEMRQADIFIAPSITAKNGDMEGTPTVLMEAQAMELPVVSTLHSGIPEVVVDGGSGYLVPEKDAESLAGKISSLIDEPETRIRMGKVGRSHIEREYSSALLAGRLELIYRNLVYNTVPENKR